MAKQYSSVSEQIFINEIRHQLLAKIVSEWETDWAEKHGEVFTSLEDLPSKNAFYADLEHKIYQFLSQKYNKEGSQVKYVTRYSLLRFLDENYQKGFEIDTTLNPIAQYCGYANWAEFKELNPEVLPQHYPLMLYQKGEVLAPNVFIFQIPQRTKAWRKVLLILSALLFLGYGLYYYFYQYLPFRILTKEELNTFECTLVRQESDQGRNPLKAYFKYDFSKLRLDSLNVSFAGNRGNNEHGYLTLTNPKGEFTFDYYKAGVHEVWITHQGKMIKRLIVLVKSHGWSCWYQHLTPSDPWINTNFKYADFYTDGYLHAPRERITPNH